MDRLSIGKLLRKVLNTLWHQCGVLTEFRGIAVHDCWASYWNYPEIQHAVCCAHLLRELTGIIENHHYTILK